MTVFGGLLVRDLCPHDDTNIIGGSVSPQTKRASIISVYLSWQESINIFSDILLLSSAFGLWIQEYGQMLPDVL